MTSPDTRGDVRPKVSEGERVFIGQTCVVILEVVDDTHNGTVFTGAAARVEWLEADVTESDITFSAIIVCVVHYHVLQVPLQLIHLQHTTRSKVKEMIKSQHKGTKAECVTFRIRT